MSDSEWLLFLAQLPATPSSLRVNIWRRLRGAGAASLQNGVWILPLSDENAVFMERLLGYVRQNRATGQVFQVQGLNQATQEDIQSRFRDDRKAEYDEFLEQCQAFIVELDKETQAGKFIFAELEENEQNLQRLQKWIARIQQRDFFPSTASRQAVDFLERCRHRLQEYTAKVYEQEGIQVDPGQVSDDQRFSDPEGNHDFE